MLIRTSEKELLFIDTPYDSISTAMTLEWVYKSLKPEKILAINTGFHVDNIGGNGCLLAKGIDIYGSEQTIRLIKEKGKESLDQIISWLSPEQSKIRDVFSSMKLYCPNIAIAINDSCILKSGNYTFEIYYPGESHSPDNLVVYMKEKKLIFGGCMVKSLESKNLGFTGDANISEWKTSIEKVRARYPDTKIVIPHHGKWGGIDLLEHTLVLLKQN